MKKIYDLTKPLSNNTVVYPGDIPVKVTALSSKAKGDVVNLLALSMSSHAGTHVDAPRHLLDKGKTIENLPLELLIGPAKVVEINVDGPITREHITELNLDGVERLLFKTFNTNLSNNQFHSLYAHLSVEAAQYLVQLGCKLVAIDYLSVDPPGDRLPVHEILLGAGVIIVEGVMLKQVPAGDYELICLPLKIAGADGAPARVVLREI